VEVVAASQDVSDGIKAAVVWSRVNVQQVTQQWVQVDRLEWVGFVSLLECRTMSYEYWVHVWQ